ncbi:hypothetical protein, partial [Shimia sp. SDUM112013]|uniref:calcium-binding protein n=1 Tax=Shimia sp. SDUM112013 TaxID=3136160 RepID=UPI0032EC3EC0
MTYYTLLGYQVTYDINDNVVEVKDTSISIEMPNGVMPNLTYTFETPGNPVPDPDDEALPLVDADIPGNIEVDLLTQDLALIDETYIGFVDWDGNTTYILSFNYGPINTPATDWYFVIGGDALPDFTNSLDPVSEWNAFGESDTVITDVGHVTSGPFAPNRSIPLANLDRMIAHTGQIIEDYDPGDSMITTGAGNDGVAVGGGGWDIVRTLGGDDIVIVDDENGYTEAQADLGVGNDIYDLADVRVAFDGGAYAELVHNDQLTNGITAIIDGTQNLGRVDKGAGGETVILEIENVIQTGGFGIHGTGFADVFNLTSTDGGFVQVRGLGGNDQINIGTSNGTVRLDYRGDAAGINANLETGIIMDGFGGTDTITGRASEIRGSMHTDTILGSSADERFILMAGSDTVDGGAGTDTLRYDRSRVEAVTVDLEAGTASGVWRGESFSHSMSNIENINGSRDDSDSLAGDSGGNQIDGRGGNDTLLGRAGHDTLIGNYGDDSIDGGDGFDAAAFWGISRSAATITEVSPGVIQVVSGQGTDRLSNVEELWFDDQTVRVSDLFPNDNLQTGTAGADTLDGTAENDTLLGLDGNDILSGFAGDDSLDGGLGNDVLNGGDGNDYLNPGRTAEEGWDTLNPGSGNDTVDFSDVYRSGASLNHFGLSNGFVADINSAANTGTVDKGTLGTTTLIDVGNVVEWWGLEVNGTAHNDTVNFTLRENSTDWVSFWNNGGSNTINVLGGDGIVRLDYRGQSGGINANLTT